MKYAHYNEQTTELLGWYTKDIHEIIPTPNCEVSDIGWQDALNNNYNSINSTTGVLSKVDFRTLAELQEAKVKEIDKAYDSACYADIDYIGVTFQADVESQQLIVNVLSSGSVAADFAWWSKDNNPVAMTYVELQGFSGTILARGQLAFAHKQKLKVDVSGVTTEEELNLIQWV